MCRYVTSLETGSQPVTDIFHFVVYDGDNNRLDNQMCTITITSTPRQPPVVTVRSGIKVVPLINSSLHHFSPEYSCTISHKYLVDVNIDMKFESLHTTGNF